jgi:hypothetical protein
LWLSLRFIPALAWKRLIKIAKYSVRIVGVWFGFERTPPEYETENLPLGKTYSIKALNVF